MGLREPKDILIRFSLYQRMYSCTAHRCTAKTLRKWVRQGERDPGVRPGSTSTEQQRIKELEREVHELRKANET